MILSAEKFLTYGLKVSTSIPEERIEAAILAVEFEIVEQMLGDVVYEEVEQNPDHPARRDLEHGISLLTYGYLLIDSSFVTRTGAVKKQSEWSMTMQFNEQERNAYTYFRRGTDVLRSVNLEVQKFPYYGFLRGFYFKNEK